MAFLQGVWPRKVVAEAFADSAVAWLDCISPETAQRLRTKSAMLSAARTLPAISLRPAQTPTIPCIIVSREGASANTDLMQKVWQYFTRTPPSTSSVTAVLYGSPLGLFYSSRILFLLIRL